MRGPYIDGYIARNLSEPCSKVEELRGQWRSSFGRGPSRANEERVTGAARIAASPPCKVVLWKTFRGTAAAGPGRAKNYRPLLINGSEIYASTSPLAAERNAGVGTGSGRAAAGVWTADHTADGRRCCASPAAARAHCCTDRDHADTARYLPGTRTGSKSPSGPRRRCCATRPTSTSIATDASGWPKGFGTAPITRVSPKAIALSCCKTLTATARLTARTRSCRNPRSSRLSASPSSTIRWSFRSRPTSLSIPTSTGISASTRRWTNARCC